MKDEIIVIILIVYLCLTYLHTLLVQSTFSLVSSAPADLYQYELAVFYLPHSLYVTKTRDGQRTGSLVIALRPGFFILQHSEKWVDKFFSSCVEGEMDFNFLGSFTELGPVETDCLERTHHPSESTRNVACYATSSHKA
jgi:hypothetical protein